MNKIILCSVTQILLLEKKEQPVLVLIDDIIAEIDNVRQMKIIQFLNELPIQLLLRVPTGN